jgi:acyl-homoserine-lactone acylase
LWTQHHPLGDLPQYVNPRSGYLYNTNHSPFLATATADNLEPSSVDPTSGYETFHNNRSARFAELIGSTGTLDYTTFKRIKNDGHYPASFHFPVNLDALENVEAGPDSTLATVIRDYRDWDRNTGVGSKGAAVFSLLYRYFADELKMRSGTATSGQCLDAFRYARDHEVKYFGRTGITLGDLQQLTRGDRSLPIWGLPDVITSIYTEKGEQGKFKAAAGESYIELVRFPKAGLPLIETVNCYGASHDPASQHHTDQMELFRQQQLKPMTLDKAKILQEAERTYHPGNP